jgi:hypothetical protein
LSVVRLTIVDATENYRPAGISDAADPEPVAILKEQAALLGGRTNNAVEAIVKTSTEGGTAYHSLDLKADALGYYLYRDPAAPRGHERSKGSE